MTIHITPEPECSYVSFESNIPARWVSALLTNDFSEFCLITTLTIRIFSSYLDIVLRVLNTFKPGTMIIPIVKKAKHVKASNVTWAYHILSSLVTHMIIWLGKYQCAMSPLITTVIRKIHTHHLCHKNFQGGIIPQWNEEVTVIKILKFDCCLVHQRQRRLGKD